MNSLDLSRFHLTRPPLTSDPTGTEPDADLGPVISPKAKARINDLVESGIREGATCLLDGRGVKVPGYDNGNFVGPTILSDVKVRKSWEVEWLCFMEGSVVAAPLSSNHAIILLKDSKLVLHLDFGKQP